MRSKFGGVGDDEEDDDEVVKREMEENESRTKHSIDGILGDRCKCKIMILLYKPSKMLQTKWREEYPDRKAKCWFFIVGSQ